MRRNRTNSCFKFFSKFLERCVQIINLLKINVQVFYRKKKHNTLQLSMCSCSCHPYTFRFIITEEAIMAEEGRSIRRWKKGSIEKYEGIHKRTGRKGAGVWRRRRQWNGVETSRRLFPNRRPPWFSNNTRQFIPPPREKTGLLSTCTHSFPFPWRNTLLLLLILSNANVVRLILFLSNSYYKCK